MTVLFGIDVGTSATKGLAITPDGEVIATEEAAYPLSTPRAGWSEQDPEDWWRATETVLEKLTGTAGAPAGIGLSGQMHGLVALDRNDNVIRPAILWNDQRTQAECDEIENTIGLKKLIALTGNRALTGFTAPKILWLRHHEPENYKRIAHILLPKDYVRLRLTGEHATDVSDASGMLLLDVANRSWSQEVLDALEIDPAWLPAALESPTLSGQTTKNDVPVAAGAGDQAAGAVGVGVDRMGPVSVAVGTSGVVFAALDAFAADEQARVHAFCHAVPGKWHAMGVMLSAAGSLSWLRNATDPDAEFSTLLKEAEDWPPGAEGLIFLPYLAGERTPHADPDATGAFVGLTLRHNRGALTRAVLEGVAFGLRDSLDLTEELGGRPKTGRISGGGARSALWTQIIASVLQIPLEPVAVDEGAAFGAAILGGVAADVWPDVATAVRQTVKPKAPIEPVAEWIEPYREQRERFQALYPALKALR
ncbi:MAG: xylulokinase [Solirubrobacteraceae bacterium]